MNIIKEDQKFKKISLYTFIVIGWTALLVSINVGPDAIISFIDFIPNYKHIDMFNETYLFNLFLNFIRAIAPSVILILSLSVIVFRLNKIKLENINLAIIIYLLYALIQLVALYFSEIDKSSYFWIVSLLATVFLLINTSHYKAERFHLIFIISISIIFLVYIYFFQLELGKFWYSHIHIYGSFNYDTGIKIGEYIYISPTPRTSGLSRSGLFVFIICSIIFFSTSNKLYSSITGSIMMITSTSIFLFQSRTLITCFIIACFVISFLFLNYNFKKKILVNLLLIVMPILIAALITIMRPGLDDIAKKQQDSSIAADERNFLKKFRSRIDLQSTYFIRELDPESFSSKRTMYWKTLFEQSKNKLFIGYGPQADRHFLDYRSASNTLFYSLICAGLPGVILMLLLYILTLKELFIFWTGNNTIKKDLIIEKSSFIILIVICLRSVLETNHAVFSIDFLFFILCFSILNKKNNSKSF